jgi:hypothetical protein
VRVDCVNRTPAGVLWAAGDRIGAYLHFQNSEEKNKIVQAAKKASMSLNAYITAVVATR